jgi:PAS domain S-box-containing protein
MSDPSSAHGDQLAARTARDLDAFLALISSLSGRLAAASGNAVDREVESGLRELLTFFDVEQCGILEIQPDLRHARLSHRVSVEGVPPVPTTLDYAAFLPWTHEHVTVQGKLFAQTCIDDLPPEAVLDRSGAARLGLQSIISVPVGSGGRIMHVLCLASSKPTRSWPASILAWLQMIAETFLAALARYHTEEALEVSERSLAEAQRLAGVGSYVCDEGSGALAASEEANRIFGVVLSEAGDLLRFIHPDDRARVEEAQAQMRATHGSTTELEYRIVRPDGTVRTIRSRTETTYSAEEKPLHTLATIQDITDLRAAEAESRRLRAELRHADRAAHAGALTASLSHELNQPLTSILANSQAGLRQLEQGVVEPSELHTILELIVRDNRRAASVVANLRTLLRREEPARATFDLAEAISEVQTLFKAEMEARRVNFEAQLEPDCIVMAVRTQIQQVILNLLSNAVHAMEDTPIGERNLAVSLVRTGRDRVEVEVRDNGVGMSPDTLQRVFEPFFTTRSDGLGMGLAISRSIVETHGGVIDARISGGGGVTFRISLPAEPPSGVPRSGTPSAETGVDRHTQERQRDAAVIVVDDDAAIRDGVVRLLGAAGWKASSFDSATAALASPSLAGARCLVLDVQMPGISGPELQAELARRGSDIPVIVLSARGDAATGVDAMKGGAVEYLTKPVDDSVLVEAVRKALELHAERSRSLRERKAAEERLARLTPRERDVLQQVIAGRLNKQIGFDLSISEATVKQHRAQVMEKMAVRSVADLVRLCQIAGFPVTP